MLILFKKCLILFILLDVCLAEFEDKYIRTFRDKRYSLYTYLKISNVNELQCTLACSNDEECGSINHKKDEKFCELNQLMDEEHQRDDLQNDKGWNHFIKSKVKPTSLISDNIYIPHEIHLKKSYLLTTIPVQPRTWELSFDFILLEDLSHWTQAVHFTLGCNLEASGCRTPSIFFNGRKFHAAFNTETNLNRHIEKTITLKKKTKFKLRQVVSPDGNDVYTSIHFDDKWFSEVKHHITQMFTNIKVYLGGMGDMGGSKTYPPAPVIISNFRYIQGNLFYPGQIITMKKIHQVFGELKSWPPESWFVSFDYFSSQTIVPSLFYNTLLSFSKKGTIYPEPGNRIIYLERIPNQNQMKTFVELSGNSAHTLCYRDIGFAANTFLKIRLQQKRESDGKLYVKLFLNGDEKCWHENTTPTTYDDVQILFEGYDTPNGPEVIIKNFEFGEL
eukprot:TCONS_00065931-protein